MKFEPTVSDAAFLRELGQRLAQLRLAKNMTQEQVAEEAGLGWRTLQRLELGAAATRLSGFVRVCRVLGLVERFEVLVPDAAISPIAQLRLQGHKRQRARGRKATGVEPKKWTWGESS